MKIDLHIHTAPLSACSYIDPRELIQEARRAGADAIKFQAFQAALLCDLDLTETKDVESITGGTKSSYEMYKRLELSNNDINELYLFARKEGILFFVFAFSRRLQSNPAFFVSGRF